MALAFTALICPAGSTRCGSIACTLTDRFSWLSGASSASNAGSTWAWTCCFLTRVLQDGRSGLFSHGFDDAAGLANGVFWGRGQCWALVGLVDTLRELSGAGHSDELELRDRLSSLVAGLDATEADGRWHTVVNHSKTYLEASVGAFVAHGVFEAIDCGLVDATHRGMAERAWQATIARVNEDGELVGVSDATPVGADAAHYAARARGVFPWGQGPALLAAQNRRTHLLIP